MGLLDNWRIAAYGKNTDKNVSQKAHQVRQEKLWEEYFLLEKGIYKELLKNPDEAVSGTVKELTEKYNVSVFIMTGFLDGIQESLRQPNPIEEMDEDTLVSLDFDNEKLYKNMVDAKADWLYNLPEWEPIFDEDKRRALYFEAKRMNTIVKGQKIGRNDPCPCGSGKKYKYCCGR